MYKLWVFIREQDEWEVIYSVYSSSFCVYCSLALSRTNCHPRAVGDAKQHVKYYARNKVELQTAGHKVLTSATGRSAAARHWAPGCTAERHTNYRLLKNSSDYKTDTTVTMQ